MEKRQIRFEGRIELGDGYSVAWSPIGHIYLHTAIDGRVQESIKLERDKIPGLASAFVTIADLLEESEKDI